MTIVIHTVTDMVLQLDLTAPVNTSGIVAVLLSSENSATRKLHPRRTPVQPKPFLPTIHTTALVFCFISAPLPHPSRQSALKPLPTPIELPLDTPNPLPLGLRNHLRPPLSGTTGRPIMSILAAGERLSASRAMVDDGVTGYYIAAMVECLHNAVAGVAIFIGHRASFELVAENVRWERWRGWGGFTRMTKEVDGLAGLGHCYFPLEGLFAEKKGLYSLSLAVRGAYWE
jgi:hypothetical protein